MKNKIKKIIAAAVAVSTLILGCIGAAGCNYCAHQTEVIEKQASTCIEHGHGYGYRCKKCNKLFAYSTEKGLYEIKELEELPLSTNHTVTSEFSVKLKDGLTEASSVLDYVLTSKCELCHTEFAVSDEHIGYYVPPEFTRNADGSNKRTYQATKFHNEELERWYAEIKLFKGTEKSHRTIINPIYPIDQWNNTYDKDWVGAQGASQRAPLCVPFLDNETRYLVLIIHNTHATAPVTVEWSIDERQYRSVDVGPGEYKHLVVDGNRGLTNLAQQFMRVYDPSGEALTANMTIEMTGIFYVSNSVDKIDKDADPIKTEYAVGEKFDPTGMKLYASYKDAGPWGKVLCNSECEYSVGDRPLTAEDTSVVVYYGGKRITIPITVS